MKQQLKSLVGKTPILGSLYQALRRRRTRREYWGWTAEDEDRRRFYEQFIQPGALVFDVGANYGNRTKAFLRLGAEVVAFEPQTVCADHLESILQGQERFRLVRQALGDATGDGEMLIGSSHHLSTLSREWPEATQASGRFRRYDWVETQVVEITTMDSAIEQFGLPAFVKIDVEGYEDRVLQGLSQPVPAISFEFAAEQIQKTDRCIEHLQTLGQALFQYSSAESMTFDFPKWVEADVIRDTLAELVRRQHLAWGDVYVRFQTVGGGHRMAKSAGVDPSRQSYCPIW